MPITNAILNTKGKVDHYICSGCGCDYKMRFRDSTLCFTCLAPVFHEKERAKRILYAKNWVNKKR